MSNFSTFDFEPPPPKSDLIQREGKSDLVLLQDFYLMYFVVFLFQHYHLNVSPSTTQPDLKLQLPCVYVYALYM